MSSKVPLVFDAGGASKFTLGSSPTPKNQIEFGGLPKKVPERRTSARTSARAAAKKQENKKKSMGSPESPGTKRKPQRGLADTGKKKERHDKRKAEQKKEKQNTKKFKKLSVKRYKGPIELEKFFITDRKDNPAVHIPEILMIQNLFYPPFSNQLAL